MILDLLEHYPKILAECAIAERLRRHPEVELHPSLYNTPLIYGPPKAREIMAGFYREYMTIAGEARLPLLLTAPTWRLDSERVKAAQVPSGINTDAVHFLTKLRDEATPQKPVLVGALIGPQHDCYRPEQAPSTAEANAFHSPQIHELASTQIDFLQAQTLPSVKEAIGIAQAMATTHKPFLISFVTGLGGCVLDGTPLPEAMARVDEVAPPTGYYVNCTHPQFILDAYPKQSLGRLIGIQANASSKDVTTLDGSSATESDPLESWTRSMLRLHEEHQIPILGGCCGTSPAHLKALSL